MGNCITPDDLFNYPRCCNLTNQICCSHEGIQEALDCAYEKVSVLLCQEFCPYEGCKTFDGTGSCKLFINCQMQEVTSVEIVSCEEDCECVCKNPCDKDPELPCISGSILEYQCEGEFPCGTKNIKVCGTWGSEMPPTVKKAIIWLAMEDISPGIMGLGKCDNVKSVTWEDYSITYTNGESSDFTTGYREIDQMLIPYINQEALIGLGITSSCSCKKDDCKKCNYF